MARSGISKLDVQKARDILISDGKHPSVDAVRQLIGNTGSKSTIHRHLKELERESGETGRKQIETAAALQNLVEELAAKLHADADARLAQMRVDHEAALRRNAEEMTALRNQVNTLTLLLQAAEITRQNIEFAHDRFLNDSREKPTRKFGRNLFSGLFTTDRSGEQRRSVSDFFSNSRSGANAGNEGWHASYDELAHIFK